MSPDPPLQGKLEPESGVIQPVKTPKSTNNTAPAENENSRTLGKVAVIFSALPIAFLAWLMLPPPNDSLSFRSIIIAVLSLSLIGLLLGLVAVIVKRGRRLGYLAIVLAFCPILLPLLFILFGS
jgi:hypothetical protein